MRISINIGGDVSATPTAPIAVADQAVAAERAGFPAAWTTHFMRGTDAFPTIAVAGSRTSTIELGIGIVPTYPRHPYTMGHEAATVQSLIGGRLTLGIGVSHKPVMQGMLGFDFTAPRRPHARVPSRCSVPCCAPVRCRTAASVAGRGGLQHHRVLARCRSMIGALGPAMLRVAGELADGTIHLAGDGPRAVARTHRADVGQGRRGRRPPEPTDDRRPAGGVVRGREVGPRGARHRTFARYPTLANYHAIVGPRGRRVGCRTCASGVRATRCWANCANCCATPGATELWPVPIDVPGDPDASVARTTEFLATLAPEF